MKKELSFVLIVCKTLEDVHKAHRKYLSKKGLKLSFKQCVFQGNKKYLNLQNGDK